MGSMSPRAGGEWGGGLVLQKTVGFGFCFVFFFWLNGLGFVLCFLGVGWCSYGSFLDSF